MKFVRVEDPRLIDDVGFKDFMKKLQDSAKARGIPYYPLDLDFAWQLENESKEAKMKREPFEDLFTIFNGIDKKKKHEH